LISSESNLRAACYRRAVAAGFADDGGGFAGDGAFVDRGDTLDHFAIAGDQFASSHQHDVADLEAGGRDGFRLAIGAKTGATSSDLVFFRLSAWARPRPSATASAKVAKSTVNQSQAAIWPEKPASPGFAGEVADEEESSRRRRRSRSRR
jgi:hypothetical protein